MFDKCSFGSVFESIDIGCIPNKLPARAFPILVVAAGHTPLRGGCRENGIDPSDNPAARITGTSQ